MPQGDDIHSHADIDTRDTTAFILDGTVPYCTVQYRCLIPPDTVISHFNKNKLVPVENL